MNAFVTGATGFVGSHLVDLLLSKGWKVKVLVRKNSNLRWLEGKDVEMVVADLRSGEGLRKGVEKVDVVFHIAGVVKGRNFDDFVRGNVLATTNLLESIVKYNPEIKKFVHISSQAATRPSKDKHDFVKENDEPDPKSFYGRSKLMSEEIVRSFGDRVPFVIIRPSSVYGPRDWEFLPLFRAVKKFRVAPLIGFSERTVSIIYVKDLVNIIFESATSDKTTGNTYFACHPEPVSWKGLVNLIAEVLGVKVLRFPLPSFLVWISALAGEIYSKVSGKAVLLNLQKAREMSCKHWVCSPELLKNTLDFDSFTPHIIGVKETVEWYLDNGWI